MEKVTLQGNKISLEPLSMAHHDGLVEAITDGELWHVRETMVPFIAELPEFIAAAEAGFVNGTAQAFAIVDNNSGKVVGSTRYMNMALAHQRVEIGYTFIAKSFQRTYVNTQAKLLLLTHAFEVMKLNRVEFLTDNQNHQSKQALTRLGAVAEGVLRMHMVLRAGRLRDSVIYSIIAPDWPAVKAGLLSK